MFRMPAGIPGELVSSQCTVEPQQIGSANVPAGYGLPVGFDATGGNVGNMRSIGASDVAAFVRGFLVRPYPTTASQDGLGVSTPAAGTCDVMRRGYINVKLNFGTAVKGGPVYVWKATSSGAHVQGGIEATDPSTSGFAITGAEFVGPADANGMATIAYNL